MGLPDGIWTSYPPNGDLSEDELDPIILTRFLVLGPVTRLVVSGVSECAGSIVTAVCG